MSASHESGPLIVGPSNASSTPAQVGPSLFNDGVALLDPRPGYAPGQSEQTLVPGFPSNYIPVLDQAPSVAAVANIAAAQAAVAGTPLTLVANSGAGVTANATFTSLVTKKTVSGVLALDGVAGVVTFGGINAPIAAYDPTKALSRCVKITSVGNDSAGYFTVAGYDIYGLPMSQKIAGGNAAAVQTTKAFKYITSVTPSGAVSGANVSIGTADVFGFPLRLNSLPYADLYWNETLITANTGFTAADATAPATQVTGDVRGTYAVQSASDGTKRIKAFVTPEVAMLSLGAVGLFGQTQA